MAWFLRHITVSRLGGTTMENLNSDKRYETTTKGNNHDNSRRVTENKP